MERPTGKDKDRLGIRMVLEWEREGMNEFSLG